MTLSCCQFSVSRALQPEIGEVVMYAGTSQVMRAAAYALQQQSSLEAVTGEKCPCFRPEMSSPAGWLSAVQLEYRVSA